MSRNDKGFDRLIADYMRELFEERGVSQANREKLWKKYYDKLAKAVDVGYGPKLKQYDPQLAHSLKYNIAKFSAFKESSFKQQLEAALTKNGKIVPWSEFKKKAQALNVDYHERWLKTEYHQTVATANMAAKWKDFERNKDLYPNLKYVTVGDNRVREKHAQWDGLVLPIEHDFWKKNLPPNDWGCRCNVVQTDEEVSRDIPSAQPKKGFDNNAALSGEVFPEIPYERGMSAEAVKEAESFADKMMQTLDSYAANYGMYRKLRLDKNYTDVKFNAKTGGMKATHKLHNFDKHTGVYEKKGRDVLYNNGYRIILEQEGGKAIGIKYPDGTIDSILYDQSTILGTGKNTIKAALNHIRQKKAKIAYLYFPTAENFSFERLHTGIAMFRGQTDYRFEKIIVVIKDKIVWVE